MSNRKRRATRPQIGTKDDVVPHPLAWLGDPKALLARLVLREALATRRVWRPWPTLPRR